jgi:lipoprotein-releasing system permease protein
MITFIASFGVIVGSLALFIILSGFSGFTTFTNSMLDSSDPDLKITSVKGKSFLCTEDIATILNENKSVAAIAKIIEERVLLQYKQREEIAYIKGVSANYNQITQIDSTITLGQWLDPEFVNTGVIGYGLSNKLSLDVLSIVKVNAPKPGKGFIISANAAFTTIQVQITGAYSGLEEFANKYIFVDIRLAQLLLRYQENQISSLEVKLKEDTDRSLVAEQLQEKLGLDFNVQTKEQFNALTYKVLNTERLISYFIFTLIIIIALFNVVGAIIMMIIDKKQNLKTLFNLGATLKEIQKIFVLQGFLLTLFGLVVGLTLGIVLLFLQKKFQFFMITETIPYPVEFRFLNLFIVAITISFLGFVASKIASSRISYRFIEA